MSNSAILSKESDPPLGDDPPLSEEKKRNRRGKGSKSKQAEVFRSKKNVKFNDDLVKKIENLKISFGYTPHDLFGERMLSSVVKPQICFPINIDIVGHLCRQIVEVLHGACKIPSTSEAIETETVQYDIETLLWATALQLECKLHCARTGTQFLPCLDREMCFRAERVGLLMKKVLTPLAVVIDQIGRFTINEQLFIPDTNGVSDFIYNLIIQNHLNESRIHFPCFVEFEQPGVATNFKNHEGKVMRAVINSATIPRSIELGISDGTVFNPAFLKDPSGFPYFGLVEFVPEISPPKALPFEEVLRRYVELEGRVSKKLSNAFVEIDLSSGKGVESQLVFRRSLGNGVYAAWSPRPVRADALEIGAILDLGFPCQLGNENHAAVMSSVDTSAGIEVLANILTKKLR